VRSIWLSARSRHDELALHLLHRLDELRELSRDARDVLFGCHEMAEFYEQISADERT
jgi:hypothetical protein